jgi:hypothetical protein
MSIIVLAARMRASFPSGDVKQPVARIERSKIRERSFSFHAAPGFRYEEEKKEAERRRTQWVLMPCQRARQRATDKAACAAPPLSGALACRRSTTPLAKGSRRPQGSASGQVSWEAAPNAAACRQHHPHIQRSTSHTGHSAGGHDARSRPGAECKSARGHRTHPTARFASGRRPSGRA